MASKGLHRHGCRDCRKCYEDACGDPADNQLCYQCRAGHPGLFDMLGTFAPRSCCYTDCRVPRKNKPARIDEFETYGLSRTIPWWICAICGKTFPYRKPRPEEP